MKDTKKHYTAPALRILDFTTGDMLTASNDTTGYDDGEGVDNVIFESRRHVYDSSNWSEAE